VGDKIIVGVTAGECALCGFLDAYDAKTGKRLWRVQATAQPGDPARATWAGNSAEFGGRPTWMTGTYDAEPTPSSGARGTRRRTITGSGARAIISTWIRCSRSTPPRSPQMVFSVHSARHSRLGRERDPGSDRRRTPREASQAAAARGPQRVLLRAGPADGRIPAWQALRAPDVGEGACR
jgi:hypothetical protein